MVCAMGASERIWIGRMNIGMTLVVVSTVFSFILFQGDCVLCAANSSHFDLNELNKSKINTNFRVFVSNNVRVWRIISETHLCAKKSE